MLKAICTVAAATVVVGVLGICGVGPGSAQDAPRTVDDMRALERRAVEEAGARNDKARVVDLRAIEEARNRERAELDKERVLELRLIEDVLARRVAPPTVETRSFEIAPLQTFISEVGRNQPGTWTIIDTKAGAMLVNTATGASYLLKDAESKPRWVKVENPADATPKLGWKLETIPQAELRLWPSRPEDLRAQAAKLLEQAKAVREKWSKAESRDERRKLSDELDTLEEKAKKLNEEASKLEEDLKSREKEPRGR